MAATPIESALDKLVGHARRGDWHEVYRCASSALATLDCHSEQNRGPASDHGPKRAMAVPSSGATLIDKERDSGLREDDPQIAQWLAWCCARAAW